MPTTEAAVASQHERNCAATVAANHEPSAGERHLAALLRGGFTSHELLDKTFEPMPWLVPDLIPAEGLTVLGAKMGYGKSYFLLQLAVALSMGIPFLGRETKRQGVLYIALEDSERRIHDRLEQLKAIGTDKLLTYTHWRKGKEALEDLRLVLVARPEIKCVIIDPIVRFIDLLDENSYASAYDALVPIKGALDARKVAGVFAHHCKKSVAELDAFDDLLGSTGWGAACDTRLVIRRQRGAAEATLIAGGRDVQHSESALLFDQVRGWIFQGSAAEVRIGDAQKEITELLDDAGPLSASEIAKRLGAHYKTTYTHLSRMCESGTVAREGRRYVRGVRTWGSLTVPTPLTETTTSYTSDSNKKVSA